MYKIAASLSELDKDSIQWIQVEESVKQEAAGVTVRLATLTCVCGQARGIMLMYQCLYCRVWFCHQCAEEHFGKTVAEYRAEREGAT